MPFFFFMSMITVAARVHWYASPGSGSSHSSGPSCYNAASVIMLLAPRKPGHRARPKEGAKPDRVAAKDPNLQVNHTQCLALAKLANEKGWKLT